MNRFIVEEAPYYRWSDIELSIPSNLIWWDDGCPGGGDWIIAKPIEKLSDILTEEEIELFGEIGEVVIEDKKAIQWLKENLSPHEHWRPSNDILQLQYGRVICPNCGSPVEVERDNTQCYCLECSEKITLNPMI